MWCQGELKAHMVGLCLATMAFGTAVMAVGLWSNFVSLQVPPGVCVRAGGVGGWGRGAVSSRTRAHTPRDDPRRRRGCSRRPACSAPFRAPSSPGPPLARSPGWRAVFVGGGGGGVNCIRGGGVRQNPRHKHGVVVEPKARADISILCSCFAAAKQLRCACAILWRI